MSFNLIIVILFKNLLLFCDCLIGLGRHNKKFNDFIRDPTCMQAIIHKGLRCVFATVVYIDDTIKYFKQKLIISASSQDSSLVDIKMIALGHLSLFYCFCRSRRKQIAAFKKQFAKILFHGS